MQLIVFWSATVSLTLLLIATIIYILAHLDIFFTFVPSGQIKFVTVGQRLKKYLVNVPKRHIAGDKIEKVVSGAEGYSLLNKLLGIWFVGFWPFARVHHFRSKYERWENMDDFKVEPQDGVFDSLLWRHPYPVLVRNAELQGNVLIDIRGSILIEWVHPQVPVFILEGKWFETMLQAITGAINDLVNNVTYDQYRAADRSVRGSEFVKTILALNSKGGNLGLIRALGLKIVEVNYGDFQLSANQDDAFKATQAVELARLQGEAAVIAAQKEADAATERARGITAVGNAEAGVLEKKMAAVKDHSEVLVAEQTSEGVKGFRGSALLQGGNPAIMINTPTSPPPAP